MKYILMTSLLMLILIIGCKESKDRNNGVDSAVTSQKNEIEKISVANNSWMDAIKLNNGLKWEANIETTKSVNEMLELVKNNEPIRIEQFHDLANKLNTLKNSLVMQCTMEGAAHDNLHIWLHPLIEKIDALLKVNSIEEGKKITISIRENLNVYKNYFK